MEFLLPYLFFLFLLRSFLLLFSTCVRFCDPAMYPTLAALWAISPEDDPYFHFRVLWYTA